MQWWKQAVVGGILLPAVAFGQATTRPTTQPSATMPAESALVPGLLMDVYELPRMPTRLRRLTPGAKPAVSQVITRFRLQNKEAFGGHDEMFQMTLAGFIKIEKAGTYGFRLNTDDGSELRIDGKQIILNDGVHGQNPGVSGTVELSEGYHPIAVRYFQADYGFGFGFSWQPPGADDFAAIPAEVLRADPSKITPPAATQSVKNRPTTLPSANDLDAVAAYVCASPGFGELNEKAGDLLITMLDSPNQISQRARKAVGKMLADVNYDKLSKENQGRFLKGFLQSTFSFQTDRPFNGERTAVEKVDTKQMSLRFWQGRQAEGYRTTYKIDGRELWVNHTKADMPEVERAAKALAGLPDFLRRYVKTITIDPSNQNQYNGGGNGIWIRLSRSPELSQINSVFAHEIGHVLDSHTGANAVWQDVMEADYCSISGYGNRNRSEDFAEFTRLYLSCMNDPEAVESIKQLFPHRYTAFMTCWMKAKADFARTGQGNERPDDD
ncbi:MAG: PA14 domain-containing protein [Tepidisphaeraceae bacterium]